jgi:hypothetical protein
MTDQKTSSSFFKKNQVNFIVLISLLNYFCIHFFVLPGSAACAAFYDDGWMSVVTMVMIGANSSIIVWLLCGSKTKKEVLTYMSMLIVNQIYAFREADFHKAFTEQYDVSSVTKLKFYLQDGIPVIAKIIPAVILTIFAIAAGILLFYYGIKIVKEFFKGNPSAIAFSLWGGLLLLSQIFDRMRILYESPSWRIRSIEEMCEVSSSVFGVVAMILFIIAYKINNKMVDCDTGKESNPK